METAPTGSESSDVDSSESTSAESESESDSNESESDDSALADQGEHPENHGADVSSAAHSCPKGPQGAHGKCVSAVAHPSH